MTPSFADMRHVASHRHAHRRIGRPILDGIETKVAKPLLQTRTSLVPLRLQSDFPIDANWRAVLSRDDGAMEAIDLKADPIWLLIRRIPFGVDVDRLRARQWRFAAALFAGSPLHAALEEVSSPEMDTWLATLLASGCLWPSA